MILLPLFFLFGLSFSRPTFLIAKTYDLIPPVTVGNSERRPPRDDPKNGEDKTAKYYSNDASTGYTCTYNLSFSNSFAPKTRQPTAAPYSTPGPEEPDPYDVNEIQDLRNSDNYHTFGPRTASSWLAKDPPINPDATADDRTTSFTSYRDDGRNASVRTLPDNLKTYLKGEFIKQATLTLVNGNEIATDEQLGWACGTNFRPLFPKPSGCRPVTISEIGHYFSQKSDSFIYIVKDYGEIEKVPLPSDVVGALNDHYGGNGYRDRFGTSFSPLSSSAYELLYNEMPIIPRGSVNNLIVVHHFKEDNSGNRIEEIENINKTLPLNVPISSSQANYTLTLIKPDEQVAVSDSNTFCTDTFQTPAILDKPSPVSVILWVKKFFGTIIADPQTYSDVNRIDVLIPNETINGINASETTLGNFINQDDHDKYQFNKISKSSTGGLINANIPEPGLRDSKMREYFYYSMAPDDWRSDPNF